MARSRISRQLTWLAAGLIGGAVIGLLVCGYWPNAPLHAYATDRSGSFAMATGPVDEEFEAVYFLDFLTGDLTGLVIGRQGNGFTGSYRYNVLNDFGGLDPSKNPQFMMTTGLANLRGRGGGVQPGIGIVYIAEITTGIVVAYAAPWNRAAHSAGRATGPLPMQPVGVSRFRAAAAGGTPAIPAPGAPGGAPAIPRP